MALKCHGNPSFKRPATLINWYIDFSLQKKPKSRKFRKSHVAPKFKRSKVFPTQNFQSTPSKPLNPTTTFSSLFIFQNSLLPSIASPIHLYDSLSLSLSLPTLPPPLPLSPNMSSFKSLVSLSSVVNGGSNNGVPGEIHVIVGPMFAGKSTALLRRIKSESNNGRSLQFSSFILLIN